MSRDLLKPGMAFRSNLIEEGVFLLAFQSTIRTGEILLRRFNKVEGFVENEWYRFPTSSQLLYRAKEFDFVR